MTTYTVGGATLLTHALPTYTVPAAGTDTVNGNTVTFLNPTSAPGYPALIYCHPLGGTGGEVATDTICGALARWGFPVIGSQQGGTNLWNNPAAMTATDDMVAYAIAELGADPDLNIFYGLSMGGAPSLKYCSENLERIVCWFGLSNICSMQYFYDTQSSSSIDAAFGGAPGWVTAAPTHDPQLIAEAGDLDGLNGHIWYGDADTTIGAPTTVTDLVAEVPTIGTTEYVGGHFDVVNRVNPITVASWAARQYAPTAAYFEPVT